MRSGVAQVVTLFSMFFAGISGEGYDAPES